MLKYVLHFFSPFVNGVCFASLLFQINIAFCNSYHVVLCLVCELAFVEFS